jgi:nitroalkane oxidase
MIDFVLTTAQQSLRGSVRLFANAYLVPARKVYEDLPAGKPRKDTSSNGDHSDSVVFVNRTTRFQSTKPVLATATSIGLVKSLVPPDLGGSSGTLVDSIIIAEELFAVEPSISLTLLAIGLGLTPVFLGDFKGREDLRSEILAPFTKQGDGIAAPLASLCFSEPTGSANFLEEDGNGVQTTADYDADTDSWIVHGDKIWGTNCCGWDDLGADLQVLFVRNPAVSTSKVDSSMLILLTRAILDENRSSGNHNCFSVIRHLTTPGFTATAGPHVRFSKLRIPSRYVLAAGADAAQIITATFTSSAVIVGAMSVGIMRAAFGSALHFARTHTAGGRVTILEHQSPADVLIDIKCRIEACRALTWKAAAAIDQNLPGADELAYEAKIFASEAAVKSVEEAMRVVGVSAYDGDKWPFTRLMADALVLPIFDGGNQGVRRRQIQKIFLEEGYQPWATTFGVERSQSENVA